VNDKPVIAVTGTLLAWGLDERLRAQLAEMAPHAAGIISFGMAGAIDRHMKLGDMIIGSRLIGGFAGDCDEAWVKALRSDPHRESGRDACRWPLLRRPSQQE
jgi:hypothetical protein